jgi:hypothetical protein
MAHDLSVPIRPIRSDNADASVRQPFTRLS